MTKAYGMAYGATIALLLEDAIVPAAELSKPPFDRPLMSHAFGLASHLVFGVTAEGTRAALRHRG